MAEPTLLQRLIEAGIVPADTSRVIIDVFVDEPVRISFELGNESFAAIAWDMLVEGDIQVVDKPTHYNRWASSLPF